MKKFALVLAGITIGLTAAVYAQSPAPQPDTLKDPIDQGDPELKVLPRDNANYAETQIKITPKQIPAAVKQTLESGTQYSGWEKGSLYRDKSGKKFIVEIMKADTTRTYFFDPSGKPLIE